MKMRGIIAITLTLCLILSSIPALAAPARDVRTMEATADEKMRTLIDIMLIASAGELFAFPETLTLAPGQQPDHALTERAIAAAAYVRDESDLSDEEAAHLYRQLFTAGQYAFPAGGEYTLSESVSYSVTGKILTVDASPAPVSPAFGAYIYSTQFDGDDVQVGCDLYHTDHAFDGMDADDIPEESLVWIRGARFSLHFAPETEYGYTVNGFSYTPAYQDGDLTVWQEIENTEFEYSFNLPARLGLADDTPARMVWQSADGAACLTVETEEGSKTFDEALALFTLTHPGQTVIQERLFDDFYAFSDGVFTLIVVSEDLPWHYTLTFTFPTERQTEYELYSEIIRNSFIAWGISNG